MPIYHIAVLFSLLLLIVPWPAAAEFYQYVDSKGITHFTDNPSTIPPQYQSQIDDHQEVFKNREESYASGQGGSETDGTGLFYEIKPDREPAYDASSPEISELAEKQKTLLNRKQLLNQTYETLMDEKRTLEKNRQLIEDEESAEAYNRKVKEINEKIRKYKEAEKRFISEVSQYNASIK